MGHDAVNPITLEQWKAAARKGEAPPADAILRKQYVADSVKAAGGRKMTFTISTGAIDRDRDTVKVDGWRLDNYRKNPVVLWAHNSRELPIGRAVSILTGSGALKATAEFADAETYPFADTVYRMLEGGYLRATSVGFLPIRGLWNEERMGVDFEEQELLEFSIVPVPANPEALMDAKAAGIDLAPLKAWAEQVLDGVEPGLWLPKAAALRALEVITAPRVVVPAFDPAPFVAGARSACEKRGRVLSSANEERIRGAADSASAIGVALEEVLGQLEPEEPDPNKGAPVVLFTPSPPSQTFLVDPEALKAAARAAVSETVRDAVNAARGRLD